MRQIASFAGVRSSFLLSELEKLGKVFPPALAALQERRDNAERRFSASKSDADALMDYASLNRALGEDQKTLALFNSLPADDERRRYLAYEVSDQLIEAQRYIELAQAHDYSSYAMVFDSSTNARVLAKLPTHNLGEFKRNVSNVTAKNIEALAGAGDLAHASELIAKLLAFDNTNETRAVLQTHLTRSGHPELLK